MESLSRNPNISSPNQEVALPDLVIAAARLQFTPSQLESLPIAFGRGVDPMAAVLLGVHGFNAAGEDLPLVDGDELERRLRTIGQLLQADEPSAWLESYAEQVLTERRRRRKVAA